MAQQHPRSNGRTATRDLDDGASTLGELRAFVDDCQGMPDEAQVTVRIGFRGGNRHGSRLIGIAAVDDGVAGRT